jgi:hypothetical protein
MHTTTLAKARKVFVGSVAAATVALPLALASASSAEASTTRNGCTVRPLAPVRVGHTNLIRFPIRVTCLPNRIIQIQQQRYEADPPAGLAGDDFLGSVTRRRAFTVGTTVILSSTRALPNTESGAEEIYHRVRFRVATIRGTTAFTRYESSAVRSFFN